MNEALSALGRATGVVALVLLTLGVILGIVTRSGRPLLSLPRFSVQALHRDLAILASVFTLIHVATLLVDPMAQLRLIDVFVPFVGRYAPVWLGFGTVGFDLVIAVMLTALFRRWIGVRSFRIVHWLVYALWPIAFLHSIGMGSDRFQGWFVLLSWASAILVIAAVAWRCSRNFSEYRRARTDQSS